MADPRDDIDPEQQFITAREQLLAARGELAARADLNPRPVSGRPSAFKEIGYAALGVGAAVLARKYMNPTRLMRGLSDIGGVGYGIRDLVRAPIEGMVEEFYLRNVVPGAARSANNLISGLGAGSRNFARNRGRAIPELATEVQSILSTFEGIPGDQAFGYKMAGSGLSMAQFQHQKLLQRFSPKNVGNLRSLTVGELLEGNRFQGLVDSRVVDTLQRARQLNIVSPGMSLSSSSLFGHFLDPAGKLVETQWAAPKNLFNTAYKALSQFQIMGFRPADMVFGPLSGMMFPAKHGTVGAGVMLPNGIRAGKGFNFNAGGDVFSLVRKAARNKGAPEFQQVATGLRGYDVSAPGAQFWGRALSARYGVLANEMNMGLEGRLADKYKNPVRHFWQRIQQATGVGPEFQTERPVFGKILDFYKRRNANPNQWKARSFVPLRTTLGGMDEAAYRIQLERAGLNADELLGMAVPNTSNDFSKLSFFQKLKEYANLGDKRGDFFTSAVEPGKRFPTRIGAPTVPRRPMQGFTPATKPLHVGPGGMPADMGPASVAMGEQGAGEVFSVFMHHTTDRLNALIGATTGFGFRPTPGKYGWLGNLGKLYGMSVATWMGLEYAKYGDYLAGQALSVVPGLDDTTPSQYAVGAYTKAQVLRQHVRSALGIQQTAAYAEGLMPGSMSLPGSWIARTVIPPAGGAFFGGIPGLAMGAGVAALIGGSDVGATPQELSDIYAGRKEIPIRQARWWALGLQPWRGEKVSYYQPHWAARYQSDYRFTGSQYGSKEEYFRYASPAPTPSNLFGLMKLANPDYFAEKHMYTRPYPFSPTGERMHEGSEFFPTGTLANQVSEDLGYSPTPGVFVPGADPSSPTALAKRGFHYVSELAGAYKFLLENIPGYKSLVGNKMEAEYSANASLITSFSRNYYDENLGGLLGNTELLRRYLDPAHGRQGPNFIPNLMPDWLPGARSRFKSDRDYYVDFTLGDPYARLQQGEARLPGPGYEALHSLNSGQPGVYDDFDKYKILADVAPYSSAYRKYKALAQDMLATGKLNEGSINEFYETENQVRAVTQGPEYSPRRFSGVRSGNLEQLASVNQYSVPERALGAGWEIFTHDVIPGIGRTIPLFGTALDRKLLGQRSAYESYLEDQVYGTDFHDWTKPYRSFMKPRAMNLIGSNPIEAAAGGAGLSMYFGATPLGAAVGVLGAAGLGGAATVRMATTGRMRGGWIPEQTREQNEAEEYFDALQYVKAQRNANLARQTGNTSYVPRFALEASRTAVGVPYGSRGFSFDELAAQRTGQSLKRYSRTFLNAPEASRDELMEVLPDMAKPMFASSWAKMGDSRYQESPSQSADARANEIVNRLGMPSDDWAGWAPDVPMEVIKIKTLDNKYNRAYDMHRHNLWAQDRMLADRGFTNMTAAY